MNVFKVKLTFPTDAERIYGASVLEMDVIAKSKESAILKAERTIPTSLLEWLIKAEICN